MNKAVDAQFIIWRDRAETAEAKLEVINSICHVPSNGQNAYTHFMRDFDAIRKICRSPAAVSLHDGEQ